MATKYRIGYACIALAALAVVFHPAASSARTLDCPMREKPYSVDSPLIDIILSPAATAALRRATPTLLTGLPPRILATSAPTQGAILTPRTLLALKQIDATNIGRLDKALRAVHVTPVDRHARCARYDDDALALPPSSGRPRVLVFEKITGFRDGLSVEAARAALREIADRRGWELVVTDRGGAMTPKTLATANVVVWNNVSGDVLTKGQRRAFRNYVEQGGGFVGLHGSGGDPSYNWSWYADRLIGARFLGHPMAPQFQTARVLIDDAKDPISFGLPSVWMMNDEWYSFANNPRASGAHVLLRLDENSYTPREMGRSIAMGTDHPIAWTRCVHKGRSFYSAIGHRPEIYAEPHHVRFLEQAISWAADLNGSGCAVRPATFAHDGRQG